MTRPTQRYIAITLVVLLLATIPSAYAEPHHSPPKHQKQTFTAYIEGGVTDLGEQTYKIKGEGGVVNSLLTITDLTDTNIRFDLEAKVVDTDTYGEAELKVKGKSSEGKVEVEAEFQITGGLTAPDLTLPNGDNIPLVFIGAGKAEVEVGGSESTYDIMVAVDTVNAQHPFKGDLGHTGMVSIVEVNGLFAVDVAVTKFDVKYRNVILEGVVSGDMTGTVTMMVDSDEDHVANIQRDRGQISFSVVYGGESITMSGSFKGKSIQLPELFYLYYSTGRFKTQGELRSTGTYETVWVAPLTFSSTFQGTVKG